MSIRRLCALAVLVVVVAPAAPDELKTLDGKSIVGTVMSLTNSEVVVKTPKGDEKVPLAQVLALDLRAVKGIGAERYSDVRLLDDTVLHCAKVAFKGKEVQLGLPAGTTIALPVNFVVSVLHNAQDGAIRKKWDELASPKAKKDRIVVVKNGELNPLEGTFGEVDAEGKTIQFRRETGEVLAIPLDRLDGMIFHRLEVPQDNPLCRVLDSQGNSLVAVKLAFDGKKYLVTTSFGAKIPFEAESLAKFDFNMGKLTYVSELEPSKETPGEGISGKGQFFKIDPNRPILMEGTSYGRGLWMKAPYVIEYDLAGKYKEFKALLGVDPEFLGESKAVVKIFCDAEPEPLLSVVPARKVRPVAVIVKNVTKLKIVIEPSNPPDNTGAHAVLAEARVSQ